MQRFRRAVKKLPTKLRRGSKLLDVHILSDHALQDEIEGEKTVVLTNSIDIGSEITTANTVTCSCTGDERDDYVGVDGQVEASRSTHETTGMEVLPLSLQQSPRDDMDMKILTESESGNKLFPEGDIDHTNKTLDGERYCTCLNEELCPCQWEENSTMVHLTNLICTSSRIWGRIQVNNVAYEKQILIRWSSDAWKSFSEQTACFEQSETNQQRDAFTFEIERPQHGEMVELAVRYCVCNHEYWDNNDGANYQVLGTY